MTSNNNMVTNTWQNLWSYEGKKKIVSFTLQYPLHETQPSFQTRKNMTTKQNFAIILLRVRQLVLGKQLIWKQKFKQLLQKESGGDNQSKRLSVQISYAFQLSEVHC